MRKVIFLIVMLMIPVGIILFLHGFGKNKFDVPVFYSNAAEQAVADCDLPEGQHFIPAFAYTDQANQPVNQNLFTDKLTVVGFMYTQCPDVCQEVTEQMQRVQEAFRADMDLQLLTFTVDPEHDTPDKLAAYATNHRIQGKNWRLVTGDKAALYRTVRCGFLVPEQDKAVESGDLLQTDKLVLVDGQRRIRGYYAGNNRQDVDRLIQEIKLIQMEN